MKMQDFSALNIGPDDDDFNDPANQDDYPETDGEEETEGDELDTEDTDDEELTDDEDIDENEEGPRSDRSTNDVDGNGGYPDDKGAINPGVS